MEFFFFFFYCALGWRDGVAMDGTGRGRMCLKMLDGRMVEKVGGGGGGGGEREFCIVKSHGRHYAKRRISFSA